MTIITLPQTPDDPRKVMDGIDVDGNFTFRQVGIEELSYKGRFGATVTSTSEHSISIGDKYFVLDYEEDTFRVGDDVLINCLDDPACFMWGEVTAKDTAASPSELRVYIDDLSSAVITSRNWQLQVVARPKPGIEKDTSTSSVNPTTAGPHTFTVSSGKFFPIGGKLLIKPTTDRTIAYIGKVLAYSSTTLTVEKVVTNATISTSYTSWALALLDAPQQAMPKLGIAGLKITNPTALNFTINPGTVRSFDDTVDLVLSTPMTKDLTAVWVAGSGGGAAHKVLQTGTVSSVGVNVTGAGTTFTSAFSPHAATSDDLDEQTGPANTYSTNSIINANGVTSGIASLTSGTAMTTNVALGAGAGTVFYLGGPASSSPTINEQLEYFIYLIRKDSDGSIDVCFSSATADGSDNFPTGYTKGRLLGHVYMYYTAGGWVCWIVQDLYQTVFPFALKERPYLLYNNTNLDLNDFERSATNSTSITVSETGGQTFQWQRAALTGDVTATANSNATTIASHVVSNAKLTQVSTNTIKGRVTAGVGDVENLTAAQAKTILAVTSSDISDFTEAAQDAVGAAVTDTATIDFTYSDVANTITADVINDSITYAKIQNVTATDKVLGRSTAGAGDVEEITCTAAGRALIDDADASAQRTTLGLGTLATQSGTFSGTSSGTNTGDQNIFQTIAVSGQSNVVADTTSDTLTLAAGGNITLTTDAATDTVTIAVTDANKFKTISVSGQSDVVADSSTDTLTLVGSGVTITTDASTDTITFTSTSGTAASQAEQEAASSLTVFTSPGRQHFHPAMPKAVYSATVTPTAVAGAATSWNTATDICLWNTTHGLTTGDTIMLVTNAPAGTTNLTCYYVNVVDTTHFSLHTTLAGALAATGLVNVTTSTLTTIRKWVFSNVTPGASGYGMSSVSPFSAVPATTTIQLVANPSVTLSSAFAVADLNVKNLFDVAGPAVQFLWFQGMPTSMTTTTITFSNLTCPGSGIGTWQSQATNAFVVSFVMWGDL